MVTVLLYFIKVCYVCARVLTLPLTWPRSAIGCSMHSRTGLMVPSMYADGGISKQHQQCLEVLDGLTTSLCS
jgi:hypothetical protein